MRLRCWMGAALGMCAACMLRGQTTSITDSRTPPAVAAGIPASSYTLSNIDTVDPYTGSVNIHIPLYKVGGRGEAGYTVTLLMEQKWQLVTHTDATGNPYLYAEPGNVDDAISYYLPTIVRYTPGVVFSRESTDSSAGTFPCTAGGVAGTGYTYYYGELLTRVTFIDKTGTEHELVDTQTNGQPIALSPPPNCATDPINGGTDRGRIFRSTDASDLVFVADSDVRDRIARLTRDPEVVPVMLSGWLLFPNGKKFRVDSGRVSSITDRNGNQTTISGGTATDPLGRAIQIALGGSAGAADTITYPGFNGAQRKITVNYALLQNALASGQSLETMAQLFPTLPNESTQTQYNPSVVSSVVLADGKSEYTFQYNSYGEVAKMTLPTGGAIGYAYPATMQACGSGGTGCVMSLHDSQGNLVGVVERRLLARYEYANGPALTRQTNYTYAVTSQYSTQVTEVDEDGSGNALRQVQDYLAGDAWSPDVWGTAADYYGDAGSGTPYETVTLSGGGQVLRQEYQAHAWRACAASNWPQTGGGAEPCWWVSLNWPMNHDLQLCGKWTVLADGSPAPSAATLFQYDQNNNVTDSYEYDYGAGPAASTNSCPGVSGGWTRHVHTAYAGGTYATFNTGTPVVSAWQPGLASDRQTLNGAGTKIGEQQFSYDQQNLVNESGIVGYSSSFAGVSARGNLTTSASWQSTNNTYPAHTYTYDIAGNVLTDKDANGHTTSYGYGDNYSDGVNRNTYAHVTSETNALGMAAHWQWDFGAGKVTTATDINNVSTTYSYSDALDRMTQKAEAAGLSGFEAQTSVAYTSPTDINVYRDQNTFGKGELHTETLYDGMGRQTEARQYESASGYISTTTSYDALGRVAQTTNPSRPGDGLNYATAYGYDALGRTVSVRTADGSVARTSYTGFYTTATDQAGNARVTQTDALGRLTAVWEDPAHYNYETTYSYDVLDDLTGVYQGSETRTFGYDSLKRLLSAANPESGTTSYSYDGVGNLLTKTDARGIQTSYSYDALNRVMQKAYTDGTPTVTYQYDTAGAGYSWGRLTQVSNVNSTTNYVSIDPLGRATASNQVAGGQSYGFTYYYNLAGELTSESYPSGRVVTTSYDGANRANGVTGSYNGVGTNYVSGVNYLPHGAPYYYTYGNAVWPVFTYNPRLQASGWWAAVNNNPNNFLFYFGFSYGGTNNNGNLLGMNEMVGNSVPWGSMTTYSQSFTYDALNRLTGASDSGGWSRSFGYDQYGNGWVTAASGMGYGPATPAWNVYNTKNQISSSPYDPAGNMTALPPGMTFTYDAENRQTSETNSGGMSATYYYDGDGKRVRKTLSNGQTMTYVYDALGRLAAEYDSANPPAPPCATCYLTYDHLGSLRMVTDQNANVVARHDYIPFGEEIPGGIAARNSQFGGFDNVSQRFTGKERDSETSLDYFGARYYGAGMGRWMSADPENAGASPSHPQTWNGYEYVTNSPLTDVDPDGLAGIRDPAIPGVFRQCSIEGIQTSCSMAQGLAASDAGVECPNGVCEGWATNGEGESGYVWLRASASGAEAFQSNAAFSIYNNDWGGRFLSDAQFARFVILPRIQSQRVASAKRISALSGADYYTVYRLLGEGKITGSNVNFSVQGLDLSFLSDSSVSRNNRTFGTPSVHLHADANTIHMDTASPYSRSTYFGAGLLVHFFVDVLLGNINGNIPYLR